jgi:pilus assembly protein CpaB
MNRNMRTLVVVGAAVLLASLATFGVFIAIKNSRVVEVPVRAVVVAAGKVDKDMPLGEGSLQVKSFKESDLKGLELKVFSRPEDLVGRVTASAIEAGEKITDDKLIPKDSGLWLSWKIKQGWRAMSVRVNEVVNVAGYVVPGARVDVVVTQRPGTDTASKVVLTDIEVLTAGTAKDQQTRETRDRELAKATAEAKAGDADKRIVSTVVTLLVTPEDAEKLALAQNDGTITLALRHPQDRDSPKTPGRRMEELMGLSRPRAAAEPSRVEVIRGSRLSQEPVRR